MLEKAPNTVAGILGRECFMCGKYVEPRKALYFSPTLGEFADPVEAPVHVRCLNAPTKVIEAEYLRRVGDGSGAKRFHLPGSVNPKSGEPL